MARRGRRAHRCPARVRRPSGRCAERPRRARSVEAWFARVSRCSDRATGPTPSTSCAMGGSPSRRRISERSMSRCCDPRARGSFGEMGLLKRRLVRRRSARWTKGRCSRSTRARSIACSRTPIHAPNFAPTMQALAELQELPPFAAMGTLDARGARCGTELVDVPARDSAGDRGEGVRSLLRHPLGQSHRVTATASTSGRWSRGAYFGEIGLAAAPPPGARPSQRRPHCARSHLIGRGSSGSSPNRSAKGL